MGIERAIDDFAILQPDEKGTIRTRAVACNAVIGLFARRLKLCTAKNEREHTLHASNRRLLQTVYFSKYTTH